VEAEFLPDIRIAPAQQIRALSLAQALGLAPGDIGVGKGCAKRLESLHHGCREILQRRMRLSGDQREKGAELTDHDGRDVEGRLYGAKPLERCYQFRFGPVRSQFERRLERGVKSVAPRIGGEAGYGFGRKRICRLDSNGFPGERIAAEPLGGAPGQGIVGGGSEIERIAQGWVLVRLSRRHNDVSSGRGTSRFR